MPIQIGERLPSATLNESTPKTEVKTDELFGSGKSIIFGVPGAFTPGCSNTHLPGYVENFGDFAAKGIKTIACVSVNDAFVMDAWGKAHGAEGKVRMLADPRAEFTRALGLEVDAPGLGGTRSKRYAMVVEDGKVTHLEVEPDGFGLSCSLSKPLLSKL
jgi:peroxiredoxin 5